MSDITEINVDTGQVTTRNYTQKEKTANKAIFDDSKKIVDEMMSQLQTQIDLRNSAIDKLKALGLTEDEIKTIVGA